jgi:hypothetical protein
MTANDFRRLALSLPETLESAHMAHPDFRVRGKIFATLGYPTVRWGMVKLPAEQQAALVKSHFTAFVPVKGALGRHGSTHVFLERVDKSTLRRAIRAAWRKAAPKLLAIEFEAKRAVPPPGRATDKTRK